MRVNVQLISFMRLCLDKEKVPLSWQISNIQIAEYQLSFNVHGFNCHGSILIKIVDGELGLYANNIFIQDASTPVEASRYLMNILRGILKHIGYYKKFSIYQKNSKIFNTRWLNEKTKYS